MRFSSLVLCTLALSVAIADRPVRAQQDEPSRATTLREQLASTRRVGFLRRDPGTQQYSLEDTWDKQTYKISAGSGVDLSSYVDRYVSLRGEVLEGDDQEQRQFKTHRITALDDKRRAGEERREVQAAADIVISAPQNAPLGDGSAPLTQLTPLSNAPTRAPDIVEPIPTLPPLTISPPPEASVITSDSSDWLNLQEETEVDKDRWWVRGEYLLWMMDEMDTPPLVTTSPPGTVRADAGVLGLPTTTILFGGGVNEDPQSGFRFQFGGWFDPETIRGAEGEFLWLSEQETTFADRSLGDTILARPFFNAAAGIDTSALIAFPNLLRGDISIVASSHFYSAGVRARLNRSGPLNSQYMAPGYRLDFLVGYRYAQLNDALVVYENLVSLDPLNPGLFEIVDSFKTNNEFHGIDVGFVQQATRGPFFFEWLTKVAVGFNKQSVTIAGASIIDEAGMVESFPGGILALPTNIGSYSRSEFAVLPELSALVGWNVNPRLTVTFGYSLVYLTQVVRAGEQISLDLNANQFPPPAMPVTGPLRPVFAFQDTDFWTQGISVGANYRW